MKAKQLFTNHRVCKRCGVLEWSAIENRFICGRGFIEHDFGVSPQTTSEGLRSTIEKILRESGIVTTYVVEETTSAILNVIGEEVEKKKYKRDENRMFQNPDGMGASMNIPFVEGYNACASDILEILLGKD